eukprot:m.124 g.124  ORF g.124 m.124 type:complete len:72 (+) comp68_c0_seq1:607-822(+)
MSTRGGVDPTKSFTAQSLFQINITTSAPTSVFVEVGAAGGGGGDGGNAGHVGGYSNIQINGIIVLESTGGG